MALTVLMSGAILAQAALEGFSLLRVVQTTAVLSGLVPYGLFFLIAVAYTAGAVRIAGRGALVQQVNAVESVSNVDVVCTDKTGTLTTGRLTVKEVVPVNGHDAAAPTAALGAFARNVTTPNLTTAALTAALPGELWSVRDEVPFASSLRWSGLVTDDGVWVLGAPDALDPHLTGPSLAVGTKGGPAAQRAPAIEEPSPAESRPLDATVDELAALGLRVLVLARAADSSAGLRGGGDRPALPPLRPVAVVALADELRPEVAQTIGRFQENGVAVRVLSGDDPRTVAALATQAGLDAGDPVPGVELLGLDDAALDRLVSRTTVFGRVAPEQKNGSSPHCAARAATSP